MPDDNSWDLLEEIQGKENLRALMTRFYDRLFDDIFIGFFFTGKDKQQLIQSQVDYIRANLGQEKHVYSGPPIRKAHQHLPILPGHFDRRHQILKEVLEEFHTPTHIKDAWLELDQSLRDLVIKTGKEARDEHLKP